MQKLILRGETGLLDKSALICDILMLVIFLSNQIFYGLDMWIFIVVFSVVGFLIFVFNVLPEKYYFSEKAIEIIHRFKKKVYIPYDDIFNYEAMTHDSFINMFHTNGVKVYYTVGRKKRVTLCRPCDVEMFVCALKTNCYELCEDTQECKVDIFFND